MRRPVRRGVPGVGRLIIKGAHGDPEADRDAPAAGYLLTEHSHARGKDASPYPRVARRLEGEFGQAEREVDGAVHRDPAYVTCAPNARPIPAAPTARRSGGRAVEFDELRALQFDACRRDERLDLVGLARADDRRDDGGLREEPREGDGRRLHAVREG